ncbi:MAG: prepilin-type N-terminal cleavage/methylation domain-containing protein [Chthoniobacterales bacterium]
MKMTPPSSKASSAFTLIELLVVIAIIGILMGLLFPAINGALNNAKKTAAKTDVVMLASAITAYEAEYGRLPPWGETTTATSTVMDMLMGTVSTNNPRGITFMDVGNARANSKGGLDSGRNFVDPWGNQYNIQLDTDYDNSQTDPVFGGTIRKHVLVYSTIPTIGGKANTNLRVTSWQ